MRKPKRRTGVQRKVYQLTAQLIERQKEINRLHVFLSRVGGYCESRSSEAAWKYLWELVRAQIPWDLQ